MAKGVSVEKAVKAIRRKTRRQFSAEEKIRIVLEGLRGEESIAALCRREGIAAKLYYRWSKDFLEAGKRRLLGDALDIGNLGFTLNYQVTDNAALRAGYSSNVFGDSDVDNSIIPLQLVDGWHSVVENMKKLKEH